MKTLNDLIVEAANNEELLKRCDKLKVGSYVICYHPCREKLPRFDNLREFINYQKNKEYFFNVGEKYQIENISNFTIEVVYHNRQVRNLTETYSLIGEFEKYRNFFDYFILESEWQGLQRDKKIDEIIDDIPTYKN